MWTPKKHPTLGELDVPPGSVLPLEELQAQGDLSVQGYAARGRGSSQHVGVPLTLLMVSVLVSVVQGVLQPLPFIPEFSQQCLVRE